MIDAVKRSLPFRSTLGSLPFALLVPLAVCTLAGCGDKTTVPGDDDPFLRPTGVLQLSPGNPTGKDEDPSIFKTADGHYYACWLSDRDGNDDLYVCHSFALESWDAPIRMTTHTDADWYPSILPTPAGDYLLVWMRAQTSAPFARHVIVNRSASPLSWDPTNELPVTSGLVDDFVPYPVALGPALFIYFDRGVGTSTGSRDLYFVRSDDGGATWTEAAALDDLNHALEMDSFPFVTTNPGGGLTMIWLRYAPPAQGPTPYLDPSSDLVLSTSADGVHWSAPTAVTANDGAQIVDSIPSLYSEGGDLHALWTSNLVDPTRGDIVELHLGGGATYPDSLVNLTTANAAPGWSARAIATHQLGMYIRVWVSTITGSKKVHYQLFERL